MAEKLTKKRHSLALKIIASVGVILFFSFSAWAIYHLRHNREKAMSDIAQDCDRLSEAILLGSHYAMMINERDDINQIIRNMGRMQGVEHVRIYNKAGQIKFSNLPREVGFTTGIKAQACDICHRTDPPLDAVNLNDRKRIVTLETGERYLGVISPIYNEPGCASSACHAHPPNKKILGALDVVISLEETDAQILGFQRELALFGGIVFVATSAIIIFVLECFFIIPIKRIIQGTRLIGQGQYDALADFNKDDELGGLAAAVDHMGSDIGNKQLALNRQKDEYQRLFELVPCIISVQDRDYRLISYNREFSKRFGPQTGDYCYSAYKDRSEKCQDCPVEKTFVDGRPHYSEETGVNKDGTLTHWIVKTAPMKDETGEIIGAMEMSLDITHRKQLEVRLDQSEKKYFAIFNNIPTPVFVLDAETLEILDCSDRISQVYGYHKQDVVGQSFLTFFPPEEAQRYAKLLRSGQQIDQARHLDHTGSVLFVQILLSPSQYSGRDVLLAATSDITDRLETELKLIQAGKMATLGEMATGVAHELNQPLAVIKTASSFFLRKARKKEAIDEDILSTMAEEIDSHVDRASHIINHLRQFGRKSELALEAVQVNDVLLKAFDMFSQQLKLRQIDVRWSLDQSLPQIQGEPGRLEQVFINLLLNSRDAIEEKRKMADGDQRPEKVITIKTYRKNTHVVVEVCDSGIGIPERNRGKIFEPFFTTKKVGEGTGIGLSISYGIIKDFGGTIRVRSEKSQGACFIITFPSGQAHAH
ncbi:MAG: PAS domain S-box protein [Desulfobacteraceae bacterium]|jgi:histidine kinase